MKRKLVLYIALAFVVLALVTAASDKSKAATVAIKDLAYSNLQVVKNELVDSGKVHIRLRADGSGVLDCEGIKNCQDSGLQGKSFSIQHEFDLLMLIPTFTDKLIANISGATSEQWVTIGDWREGDWVKLSHNCQVSGSGTCSAGTCKVNMVLVGRVREEDKLILYLNGVFNSNDEYKDIVWKSLGGNGIYENVSF